MSSPRFASARALASVLDTLFEGTPYSTEVNGPNVIVSSEGAKLYWVYTSTSDFDFDCCVASDRLGVDSANTTRLYYHEVLEYYSTIIAGL